MEGLRSAAVSDGRHLLATPIDWKPSETKNSLAGITQSPLAGDAY
jgi:hypothetical protein